MPGIALRLWKTSERPAIGWARNVRRRAKHVLYLDGRWGEPARIQPNSGLERTHPMEDPSSPGTTREEDVEPLTRRTLLSNWTGYFSI
jgi:hypothetical protein